MKKTILIAIASLTALMGTAAKADGFYFGFTQGPAPVYRPVYVPPRPVYVAPAPVYYYTPAPVFTYAPRHNHHWKNCDWKHHNHGRFNSHRGHRYGY